MKIRHCLIAFLLGAAITCAPASRAREGQDPLGHFDGADCNYLYGWTFDPDVSAMSIKVHLYVDEWPSPPWSGFAGEFTASAPRPDVNAHFQIAGDHGFGIPTPERVKDGLPHTLYMFAINDAQPGVNPHLWSSPKSVTCAPAGVTYYVSGAGDDSNQGTTVATAFRSVNRVNALALAPGDTVAFEGGTTFNGNLVLRHSGTAALPIRVTSYATAAGERAHIHAGTGQGVGLEDNEYVSVSKLRITGSGVATNLAQGIKLVRNVPGARRLKGLAIDSVEISGFHWSGIDFGAAGDVPFAYDGIRVTNADVHDNGWTGMWMGGCTWDPAARAAGTYCHENVYVGHSRFYNNLGVNANGWSGSGVWFNQVKGGVIEHTLAYNNGINNTYPGGGPIGIWAAWCSDLLIQFNESFSNRTSTLDGGGFDLDGGVRNSVMQYNYSHDNDGAGFLVWAFDSDAPTNNVIRYNVSQNDGARRTYYGGILVGSGAGYVSGLQIYGNTIYTAHGEGSAPVGFMGAVYGVAVHNNLFLTAAGTPAVWDRSWSASVALQGNLYWAYDGAPQFLWAGQAYTGLNDWRSATGQEMLGSAAVGYEMDPQLIAPGGGWTVWDTTNLSSLYPYQLAPYSPARDLGLYLPALGAAPGPRDFYGNPVPRGAAFDIGAHELPPP